MNESEFIAPREWQSDQTKIYLVVTPQQEPYMRVEVFYVSARVLMFCVRRKT